MTNNGLDQLVEYVETVRRTVNEEITPEDRSEFGQYMTPPPVSRLMASMFELKPRDIQVLDPGSGVGSLTAAFVEVACSVPDPPSRIALTAYEIDPQLIAPLRCNLDRCRDVCRAYGIDFEFEVRNDDFIARSILNNDCFDFVIMNPPYRKINSNTETRAMLRAQGIETSNLYTAFMALASRKLTPDGQLVSISPRSFCNGTYFRSFRQDFLKKMTFRRIHVYESRSKAFAGDEVLQENVIVHATKSTRQPSRVQISTTTRSGDQIRSVPYSHVVHPDDPESFIRIVTDRNGDHVAKDINALPCVLHQLGVKVSTGRVVDFRAKHHLRFNPDRETVPLLYPCHFSSGYIEWPQIGSKKPNAILSNSETASLLLPTGFYVVVKRFSAKEEKRRLVASVHRPTDTNAELIGIENHLNYFHKGGLGLEKSMAVGLATYLNSTILDNYFRLFSGHTQVNATDLRSIPYPTTEVLTALGKARNESDLDQEGIDSLVDTHVLGRVPKTSSR